MAARGLVSGGELGWVVGPSSAFSPLVAHNQKWVNKKWAYRENKGEITKTKPSYIMWHLGVLEEAAEYSHGISLPISQTD